MDLRFLTFSFEAKFRVFENKVLRKVKRHRRDSVNKYDMTRGRNTRLLRSTRHNRKLEVV